MLKDSVLFQLVNNTFVKKWRKVAEAEDECGFAQREKELLDALQAKLSEEANQLLRSYSVAHANSEGMIEYELIQKAFELGMQFGREIGRIYSDYDEIEIPLAYL